jgi:UDP-N-acetylglucosamine--N-acetylmuramyl-(pentapeptide) pyrophosphoryl-undecaprenol N-acetylglucosamine transferase
VRVLFSGGGTGGHLYPGLAIARALVRIRPDVTPHFIGASRGIEREILPGAGFAFTLLDAHPLYRTRPWRNWRTIAGIVSGWRALDALAREEQPALTVGTGGYASVVALLWSRVRGVPIVQQIGDALPGLAARRFARVSQACYLGFPEAMQRLPRDSDRYVVTGNPVEPPPEPRPNRSAMLREWGFPDDARVLLVFGGSQGARALNHAVAEWITRGLLNGWSVIWATGAGSYEEFEPLSHANVRVVPYLSPIARAYAVADLAIVRGGMMGTAELCAWGIPMIVVPLPTAAADHQTLNALALEAAGAAIHLPQSELSAARLDAIFRDLVASPERLRTIAEGARRRGKPHAAAEIAERISALIPPRS